MRLQHTWPGGNEYAWHVKFFEFESDRICFFSNRMYSVSKNVSFLFFPLCFGRLRCHFIELFFFAETNWHFSCFYCFELLLLLLILIILSCLNCFFLLNKLHSDQLVLFKIDWHSDLTLSRFKKN